LSTPCVVVQDVHMTTSAETAHPYLIRHVNAAGDHFLAVVMASTRVAAIRMAREEADERGYPFSGATNAVSLDFYGDFPGVIAAMVSSLPKPAKTPVD